MLICFLTIGTLIHLAIKYLSAVIPEKAGIHKNTGCRIKSGMAWLLFLLAGLIIHILIHPGRHRHIR